MFCHFSQAGICCPSPQQQYHTKANKSGNLAVKPLHRCFMTRGASFQASDHKHRVAFVAALRAVFKTVRAIQLQTTIGRVAVNNRTASDRCLFLRGAKKEIHPIQGPRTVDQSVNYSLIKSLYVTKTTLHVISCALCTTQRLRTEKNLFLYKEIIILTVLYFPIQDAYPLQCPLCSLSPLDRDKARLSPPCATSVSSASVRPPPFWFGSWFVWLVLFLFFVCMGPGRKFCSFQHRTSFCQ